jgi:hypothetical protein
MHCHFIPCMRYNVTTVLKLCVFNLLAEEGFAVLKCLGKWHASYPHMYSVVTFMVMCACAFTLISKTFCNVFSIPNGVFTNNVVLWGLCSCCLVLFSGSFGYLFSGLCVRPGSLGGGQLWKCLVTHFGKGKDTIHRACVRQPSTQWVKCVADWHRLLSPFHVVSFYVGPVCVHLYCTVFQLWLPP